MTFARIAGLPRTKPSRQVNRDRADDGAREDL